jgi:hypothetical protein
MAPQALSVVWKEIPESHQECTLPGTETHTGCSVQELGPVTQ